MKTAELERLLYLFRDLYCQNVDLSQIDEFIEDHAHQHSDWVRVEDGLPEELNEDKIAELLEPWYVAENIYLDQDGNEESVAVGLWIIDDIKDVAKAIMNYITKQP